MENNRPKLKLNLSKFDIIIEVISIIVLLTLAVFTVVNYKNLPDTVPVHFNLAGEADRFGSKKEIFALPLIAIAIYTLLTILNRYPHIFNYPTQITEANALRQYTNATRLLRYLKLIIVSIFLLIFYFTTKAADVKNTALPPWILLLAFASVTILIITFVAKSLKKTDK
ncbi:DUF1648 domain-containing protein [Pedobacter montanisoli]|uniref:DUF1648 domain-containing protein n=1 Tax=Pedobacter montanisoli TaxID=2923277 RepID=A0ABS9ZWF0_9SPHI|nr:DUF1648 domain-containing protein [Pedobacter montanisoli]MCJ0742617.1 DUF1648 domain-containing protein [Pedobacter montanisoli]